MSNKGRTYKIKCRLRNINRKVRIFDEVESTNTILLADDKCKTGDVVWAKKQTKGKGRLNRSWISQEGGLYFSVCFIVKNSVKNVFTSANSDKNAQSLILGINLSSALAVSNALDNFGIKHSGIKWPNDVYLSDKKICGILAQSVFNSDKTKIVLGIGLNVNQTMDDFPEELQNKASSLKILTGRTYFLEDILTQILKQLDSCITKIIAEKSLASIISAINEKSILAGKSVRIQSSGDIISGRVRKISDEGGLILENITSQDKNLTKNASLTLFAGEILDIY